jgi:hypothetical protein
MFELMRGDLSRVALNAEELVRLSREHDLPTWRAYGIFLEGLAGAQSGPAGGLEDMRRGVELLREQNVLTFDGSSRLRSPKPKPAPAMLTAGSPSSTKRWRHASEPSIARSRRSSIASAEKCCCCAIPQTRRQPKKP